MIDWSRRSYTESQFRQAWETSASYSEVLNKLQLNKSGGSTRIIKETATELGLSKDHFARKSTVQRYTLEEILIKDSPYKSPSSLLNRLVKEGLKELKCEGCGIVEWQGQPAPLSLDHENGDNKDNRIENLRVLCLNCHGLTPTWCGRNKVRKTSTGNLPGIGIKEYLCICGNTRDSQATVCLECYNLQNHELKEYPPTEEMIAGIEKFGYLKYSKMINVSDNGLRKALVRRGVNPLPKKLK